MECFVLKTLNYKLKKFVKEKRKKPSFIYFCVYFSFTNAVGKIRSNNSEMMDGLMDFLFVLSLFLGI